MTLLNECLFLCPKGGKMESILTSIKKLLGIAEDYEHFDSDIIIHINSGRTAPLRRSITSASCASLEKEIPHPPLRAFVKNPFTSSRENGVQTAFTQSDLSSHFNVARSCGGISGGNTSRVSIHTGTKSSRSRRPFTTSSS